MLVFRGQRQVLLQRRVQVAGIVGGQAPVGGALRPVAGVTLDVQHPQAHHKLPPTLLLDVTPDMKVMQEEVFGPFLVVMPFDTEEEALALANATPYGLASVLWTNDTKSTHRMARALNSGIVWVNCWMVRDLRTPFGGMKQSGVGREGGQDALKFFTEPKNVCIGI